MDRKHATEVGTRMGAELYLAVVPQTTRTRTRTLGGVRGRSCSPAAARDFRSKKRRRGGEVWLR